MHRPDRNLRRLIVRLSALPPEEVTAILGELATSEREKIAALLHDYQVQPGGTRSGEPVAQCTFDMTRVSPWLIERLETPDRHHMSERAVVALKSCVMRLYPIPLTPRPLPRERRRLASLTSLFAGRAAP